MTAHWRPTPKCIPTTEASRRFGRAPRTMTSRALDHPGIAEMRGGDWWFYVERMTMLRADDTGSLDDDIHDRMTDRVIRYYTDTGTVLPTS